MRGLYRYTLCKRKIQQRARTDRPLVAGCFTPLEGRAGRASSAGRPAGRRQFPGWDTRFPPRKVPVLLDRWTGPGGTRTDEPREKAPFSSSAKSPQDPSRPGGRHHKHGRDQKAVSVGFLSKTLRPDFVSGRVSFRGGNSLPSFGREKIVTWLILPVVICLSQRLSHACLSITFILGNCEWLIKSVIVYLMVLYSDNRRNSRANTCANPDFWKGRIY